MRKEVILPLMVDFMDAMVAPLVASCRAVPATPGVVARTIVTTRFTSAWTTASGTTAAAASNTVLCLLGLLISPKFLKWCKISWPLRSRILHPKFFWRTLKNNLLDIDDNAIHTELHHTICRVAEEFYRLSINIPKALLEVI